MTPYMLRTLCSISGLLALALSAATSAPAAADAPGRPTYRLLAPTNFRMTENSWNVVAFAWDDQSTGETGYELWEASPTTAWAHVRTFSANSESAGMNQYDTGLRYFKLRAVRRVGLIPEYSPFSSIIAAHVSGGPN